MTSRITLRLALPFLLASIFGASILSAGAYTNRYALILDDAPAAQQFRSRARLATIPATSYKQQIERKQRALRSELAGRKITVTSSVQTLLNAVFVVASPDRVAELRGLPGVKAVVPLRRYHYSLNRATQLVDAPAAWSALGGLSNSGKGIKIAILDTGIDQTHPAFQDNSLPAPANFPASPDPDPAFPSDPNFTNQKVIIARSYVSMLAAGSNPSNPAPDSRPDDTSARDRIGHGTATASCAGAVSNTGPAVTFNGMAPAAYLGNYKIFGSPGLNDFSSDDVIITALEDALNDGFDIASISLGGPAFSGPLDVSQSECGGVCDPLASAVQQAVQDGLVVVVAAGNDGADTNIPTLGTVSSPSDAPLAISVGATTNSHEFSAGVDISGASVPSDLKAIAADPTADGPLPNGSLTAPLVDVTKAGNDGYGCSAFSSSLAGSFALIERGPGGAATSCPFLVKVLNAQNAGAVGVIFYDNVSESLFNPSGLANTSIPAMLISNSDGLNLKSFIDAHPGYPVTLDPNTLEILLTTYNQLASFSSLGPATGTNAVKPELVATGTNVYMAVESYDPLGDLYSANRYGAFDGTSFATPIVSGAAALVLQAHPNFNPIQVKSALVNTAAQSVTQDDSGNPVSVREIGAGLLDTAAAIQQTVTVDPATLSFGALNGVGLPLTQTLQFTNAGSSSVKLTFSISAASTASTASLSVSPTSLSLGAGSNGSVTVQLSGSTPAAGVYEGFVVVQGAPKPLRIPYLFLVGDGIAANIIPLSGSGFDGTVGQQIPSNLSPQGLAFKVIDQYGLPVTNAPVTFAVLSGGGLQSGASLGSGNSTTTDQYGLAYASPVLGSSVGSYSFTGSAGGQTVEFDGTARLQPSINNGGIVDGANFTSGRAVAPGSYVTIFGSGLSDYTDFASYLPLPLSIDLATVSFDVASANISVPGHLLYVSPGQVNVQVPWELQGQTSAQVKMTIDFSFGNVVTLSLASYSPGFFEFAPGAVAALDASNRPINATNPAVPGQTIQIFANGLGPVTNQPASGSPALADPLSKTTATPTVTIGGLAAPVSFAGLAPGYPGLYQVNAVVPALGAGDHTVTLSIGGVAAKNSAIQVQ